MLPLSFFHIGLLLRLIPRTRRPVARSLEQQADLAAPRKQILAARAHRHVTNEVVYSRLAPDLLPSLRKAASKAGKKAKLHQWLTHEIGHPKLREHLASQVSILKFSDDPQQFLRNVEKNSPLIWRYTAARPG